MIMSDGIYGIIMKEISIVHHFLFKVRKIVVAPSFFLVQSKKVAIWKGKDMSKIGSGCSHDCMNCGSKGCTERFYDNTEPQDKGGNK